MKGNNYGIYQPRAEQKAIETGPEYVRHAFTVPEELRLN